MQKASTITQKKTLSRQGTAVNKVIRVRDLVGSLVKGDSPQCGEMSRSDKKGSLEKGAGCEQREQTEGLKNQSISYLKSVF